MSLPKIEHPTFDVTDPITKQKIKMRPMLVKEEKILLIAKQANNRQDQLNSVKQIIQNCVVGQIDIESLPFVSMEWLFLKLRAQSIGNVVTVNYQQSEDKQTVYKIDLDNVTVRQNDKAESTIKITDEINITLKHPTVKTFTNSAITEYDQQQLLDYMLISSIDKIFEQDNAYDCSTVSEKELREFVDSIPANCYSKIQKFFDDAPSLYYQMKIKDEQGEDQTLELTTLDDFFMFV